MNQFWPVVFPLVRPTVMLLAKVVIGLVLVSASLWGVKYFLSPGWLQAEASLQTAQAQLADLCLPLPGGGHATGQAGLLFLVPGVDETLRVNGTARLRDEPLYTDFFTAERQRPKIVIEVRVAEAYLHCSKAFMRSQLWDASRQVERASLPSAGDIFRCIYEEFDVEAYERDLQQRLRTSLY